MKRIFDFLYYCLYRVFKLVKRVGEKDENLASLFYSILLSTNTLMILFFLKFLIPKYLLSKDPHNILLKLISSSVFFIWYFYCKHYFLNKRNYLEVINIYEKKYGSKKKW